MTGVNAMDELAKRRVDALKTLSDGKLTDVYVDTLQDRRNLDFAPHFVTAIRNAGLGDRIECELLRRQEA